MATALEQFVRQLEDSGVIAPGRLQNFIPPQAQPKDAQELARQLVASKHLTKYQAREIYQGRAKSLILGNYTILDQIGAGGMGQVFKAEHRRMHRIVALKVLPTAAVKSPMADARFQREVEAAAKLEHPNIVAAYDADESGGVHFLVMQFVDGIDLSALVKKKGPLPISGAINCILQAARGLAYAHGQHVVHRDIKPGNLLLDRAGTVKILDMGLARIEGDRSAATQAELTSSGAVMGTVDYMAPEQSLNTKSVDGRADIYSLGCTLCFLLTGKPTYEGDSIAAKLLAHHQQPIPDIAALRPEVSPALQAVFSRMVAKQVGDRYQTMNEVIAALESLQSQAGSSQSSAGLAAAIDADAGTISSLHEMAAAKTAATGLVTKGFSGAAARTARQRKRTLAIAAVAVGAVVVGGAVLWLRCGAVSNPAGGAAANQAAPAAVQAKSAAPSAIPASFESSSQRHAGSSGQKPWERPDFVKWTNDVAKLPPDKQIDAVVKKLKELNPHYQGIYGGYSPRDKLTVGGKAVTEFGVLAEAITDISPVRAFRSLKSLRINGRPVRWGKLSDLSPLAGMKLMRLNCDHTQIADLSPLAGMPLKQFWCGNTLVSDLSPLKNAPLRFLHCSGSKVRDLSPLHGMSLVHLDCENTQVSDLSPLAGMQLEQVRFTPKNIVRGIEILRSMKSLKLISTDPLSVPIPANEFWKQYDAGKFE